MTISRIKVKVVRKPIVKVKVIPKIPTDLISRNFITIVRDGLTYTFDVDYNLLQPGPVANAATTMVAVLDASDGTYKVVSLASLLTTGVDLDLQAIAALTGAGILVRTADNTWALRTMTPPAAGLTITNPAGTAGNFTFALANDLAALEALNGTNIIPYRSGADAWGAVTIGTALSLTAGTLAVTDPELVALAGLVSAADKLPYFTGSGTASLADFTPFARTLLDDTSQAAMRTTLGLVPGTDVQAFDSDLSALATNTTNGLWARTGAGTGAARSIIAPAAGITVSNNDGVAGNPTMALANDLGALEALAGTGIARRTGTDAWSVGTAVSNAELATAGAATLKGNPTGSTGAVSDFTIQGLTARGAPDAANDRMLIWDAAAGTFKYVTPQQVASAGVAGVASLNGQTGALALAIVPQGRLTLTSGTPVMGSSVAGASTIYYTPYVGNQVPIYDGVNMVPTTFTELSQALSDTTKSPSAVVASRNYDLFVWNDGGTPRCTRGPDWAAGAVAGSNAVGSSARGTGAGSTELIWVNGIAVNRYAITNGPAAMRGTYVGSIRSNASGTVDQIFGGAASGGLGASLNVWNAYNQEEVRVRVTNQAAGYSLAGATAWRVAGNSANMTAYFLQGLPGKAIDPSYSDLVTTAAVTGAFVQVGVYFNAGSGTPQLRTLYQVPAAYGNLFYLSTPPYFWTPPIGANYIAAAEAPDGTNSASFNGGGATNFIGLNMRVWM